MSETHWDLESCLCNVERKKSEVESSTECKSSEKVTAGEVGSRVGVTGVGHGEEEIRNI